MVETHLFGGENLKRGGANAAYAIIEELYKRSIMADVNKLKLASSDRLDIFKENFFNVMNSIESVLALKFNPDETFNSDWILNEGNEVLLGSTPDKSSSTNIRTFFRNEISQEISDDIPRGLLEAWCDQTTQGGLTLNGLVKRGKQYRLSILGSISTPEDDNALFADSSYPWEFDVHHSDYHAHVQEAKEFMRIFCSCLFGANKLSTHRTSFVESCRGVCSDTLWSKTLKSTDVDLAKVVRDNNESSAPFYGNDPQAEIDIKIASEYFSAGFVDEPSKLLVVRACDSQDMEMDTAIPQVSYSFCDLDNWCFGSVPSHQALAVSMVAELMQRILDTEDAEYSFKGDVFDCTLYQCLCKVGEHINKNYNLGQMAPHQVKLIYNNGDNDATVTTPESSLTMDDFILRFFESDEFKEAVRGCKKNGELRSEWSVRLLSRSSNISLGELHHGPFRCTFRVKQFVGSVATVAVQIKLSLPDTFEVRIHPPLVNNTAIPSDIISKISQKGNDLYEVSINENSLANWNKFRQFLAEGKSKIQADWEKRITFMADGSSVKGYYTVHQCAVSTLKALLKNGFCGWHHSTVRSLGRTVHAILTGPHLKTTLKHFCNPATAFGEPLGYWSNYPENFNVRIDKDTYIKTFKFLQLLRGMHKDGHTTLVEPGRIMVHGPQANSLATRCFVDEILCLTPALTKLVSELWSALYACMNDNQFPINRKDCLANKLLQSKKSQRKQARQQIDRSLEWLIRNVNTSQHIILARALLATDLVSMVRADAGKRYRHLLPVNECHTAMLNVVHELLFDSVA